MTQSKKIETTPLSPYQILLIVVFGFVLFTIVVDYMTLPALSAILLPELNITTKQFGLVVSAYAFSAGISAFLATGFLDRFDRKKSLLFYYGGFTLGILLCATSNSLYSLVIARIITGSFGGVVAAICYAIVADLFHKDQRGRVMGFVQLAFAAGLVVGLPVAMYLATNYYWQLIYSIFVLIGLILLVIILFKFKPVNDHLNQKQKETPIKHSVNIVKNRDYWKLFANNILLVLGDTMFMTFGSAYSTNNLGISVDELPILYGIAGLSTIVLSPFIGQLSDKVGKLQIFIVGSVIGIVSIAVFSNLGEVPFWLVAVLHTLIFIGINARMISSTALATVIPNKNDRGSFMSLDSSFQQVTGGIGATIAGLIVFQAADGMIYGYSNLGWTVIGLMLITIGLMYSINITLKKRR